MPKLSFLVKSAIITALHLTLLLFTTKSPLTFGLILFFITLMMIFTMTFLSSSWFAMTLLLFFLGGLLVMFAYFAALSPNKPIKLTKMVILLISATFITCLKPLDLFCNQPLPNHQSLSEPSTNFLSTLLSQNHAPLLFLMIFLLLIALIAVVKITSSNKGPLRPFKRKQSKMF